MAIKFTGSICLSDIPKEQIKKVVCKDGKTRLFLNFSIHENKEVKRDAEGHGLADHFVSCAPKKEERVEGVQYIIGNVRTWVDMRNSTPTQQEINEAESLNGDSDNLPWETLFQ
jgi:hypothetical protein